MRSIEAHHMSTIQTRFFLRFSPDLKVSAYPPRQSGDDLPLLSHFREQQIRFLRVIPRNSRTTIGKYYRYI
jgi:hypothetical protein